MQEFFLVLVNFSIVAKDVSSTLEQMGIGAPLVPRAEAEAIKMLAVLDGGAALRLAVVQRDPAAFTHSPLRVALENRGAKIILVHDTAVTEPEVIPYPVLTIPFFTEDLEQAIARLQFVS